MLKLALKCINNAIFKQIYTLKLLVAFKMAYSCCFSLGGNLDFLEFLQKKFYNINYCDRTCRFARKRLSASKTPTFASCRSHLPDLDTMHTGQAKRGGPRPV